MTDKELLELAAKAAGVECKKTPIGFYLLDEDRNWNPLTDDGDALRLAVKLDIHIRPYDTSVFADHEIHGAVYNIFEDYRNHKNDKHAATRRAITRAAAEIGKATP
jgi:hypothetical protein